MSETTETPTAATIAVETAVTLTEAATATAKNCYSAAAAASTAAFKADFPTATVT